MVFVMLWVASSRLRELLADRDAELERQRGGGQRRLGDAAVEGADRGQGPPQGRARGSSGH
jgi:hypothetical protein